MNSTNFNYLAILLRTILITLLKVEPMCVLRSDLLNRFDNLSAH